MQSCAKHGYLDTSPDAKECITCVIERGGVAAVDERDVRCYRCGGDPRNCGCRITELTPAEARGIIKLINGWYEGRTLEWEGLSAATPEYAAAVKLAATAGVPMTDPSMQWAHPDED